MQKALAGRFVVGKIGPETVSELSVKLTAAEYAAMILNSLLSYAVYGIISSI